MRVATRSGAIAVAALLMLAAAPAAYAVDAPPVAQVWSFPAALSNDPNPAFLFTSTTTAHPPFSMSCQLDDGAPFNCSGGYVAYAGLTAGDHSFAITPTDALAPGETVVIDWTIDLTAPDTTVSGPAWTTTTAPGLVFSSPSVDVARYECAVGAGAFGTCLLNYAEGSVTLKVRAIDVAGNADPTPAQINFSVDSTPPETTVNISQSGTGAITHSHAGSDADSGLASITCYYSRHTFNGSSEINYAYTLDDSPFCMSPGVLLPAFPAEPRFEIEMFIWAQARDVAGNVDPTRAEATFIIDLTPPVVSIDSGPAYLSPSSTATFALSATDAHHNLQGSGIAYLECSLDGAAMRMCAPDVEFTGLADGQHTLDVRAVDRQGMVSTSYGWTWIVDTTPPLTSFTAVPAVIDPNNSGEIEWAVTGGPATSVCSLDGGVPASCSSPLAYAGLANGEHTLRVQSTDAAGNTELVGATHTWTVDTIPPTASILRAPDALTNEPMADFEFELAGATDLECTLDGDVIPCAISDSFVVANGDHILSVVGIDDAGNRSEAASHSWTVDTVAPETRFSVTPGAISGGSVTFEFGVPSESTARAAFAVAAGGDTFDCSLDGDDFESCESPVTVSGLSDGIHSFAVRAVDPAGNADPSPVAYTWVVSAAVAAVVPAEVLGATGFVVSPVGVASGVLLLLGGLLLVTRRRRA